jgi:hypothetical protein
MSTQNQPIIFPTIQLHKPVLEALDQHNKLMLSAIQASMAPIIEVQELAKKLADQMSLTLNSSLKTALLFNFNLNNYPVPEPTTKTIQLKSTYVVKPRGNEFLEVISDQYGHFWLGGRKINRANAISSRHGQLLRIFEDTKGQIVSDVQIKQQLKVTNPKQVLKDLKSELRKLGYDLKYKPLPRQGRVYEGVIKKQR